MKKFALLAFAAAAIAALPVSAFASPIGVNGKLGAEWSGISPISITANSNAPTANFGSPGTQNASAYDIYVRDDGNYFYVLLTTQDTTAPLFANLYFDTIASTPNTGSNLGFEVTNDDAFIPGVSGSVTPSSSDLIFATNTGGGGSGITVAIANTFFLIDPLNMGFAKTPAGSLVSLHLSQSFGYSVVGGGANYPAPVELGAATVGSPVPEPGTLGFMATGLLGAAGAIRRRLRS